MGVCGITPESSDLRDILLYVSMGISQYAHEARKLGASDRDVDRFVVDALFTTVTNVSFDFERLVTLIGKGVEIRQLDRELYVNACKSKGISPVELTGPCTWTPADNHDDLLQQANAIGIERLIEKFGPDVAGLQMLILYGLKGTAAYLDHAAILGYEDDEQYRHMHELLSYLAGEPTDIEMLTAKALDVGALNLKVMELLDKANTSTYGHPEPTEVLIEAVKGKAILVSGHDLKDLEELLKQTEGKDINIYTHGEMLPALAYPELKKYKHLVGNYGGAWQDQRKEFDNFPGAILMTTNCIQKPRESYHDRIFTTGLVSWPGVTHIDGDDYTAVIDAALDADGFTSDGDDRKILIGFGHNSVLGVADKVVDAVKAGKIKHFFLVGGCDGAKSGRNYYTDFAKAVPKDSVILTLACGKFRFNKLEFGDIDGIPRLLDVGQCNDAYSAVKIALALADAFDTDVNSLPLSFVLSWYEQKAVTILLTLLHLGIKGIRLGPTLPAFVTPAVLDVLVKTFDLKPTGTVTEDLDSILNPAAVTN